ncbi:MAG: 30S ribosomal protein S17e [Candidatus Parvarchaeota archaeon]|nr:30S ribosomal protein S17e [Candidatus Jingweiarchaeum tengchongense]MCW1297827.1 30S ribosomal protein S17e [Candidatus Jingweiarchaeum tengchongense]MCW1299838.1 30S ribosomal protein S17e [Candidatus Jingweiarchaeum tengchongense]MCW1304192.1 30S ribosomal protein S17e [Candidatus Jingweiarchaeum tengchongense]MCW1305220.1 30S ribosomal protein S17e [Candidatus Jingweiarchaeum tengchongense]
MGRVRTKLIKSEGKKIFDKYQDRFTKDFEHNKQVLNELITFSSKKMRNKIAGYITFLKKKEE